MSGPKLLTEAKWREIHTLAAGMRDVEGFVAEMDERGLIAPEPVDPLLEEAEALHQAWALGPYKPNGMVADPIDLALAALRRGMELAPAASPLTRERVREAVKDASLDFLLLPQEHDHPDVFQMRIKRLHAAITEQVQP